MWEQKHWRHWFGGPRGCDQGGMGRERDQYIHTDQGPHRQSRRGTIWNGLPLLPPAEGGGRALRYQMATHCQTVAQSGSRERQNIGGVNSFEGKKGGAVNFKLSTK